jgi:hypothetical protein
MSQMIRQDITHLLELYFIYVSKSETSSDLYAYDLIIPLIKIVIAEQSNKGSASVVSKIKSLLKKRLFTLKK